VSTEAIITSVDTTQSAGCSPHTPGVCQMVECLCGAVVARDVMGRKWETNGQRHPCRVIEGGR
jgi:hypothetical protein